MIWVVVSGLPAIDILSALDKQVGLIAPAASVRRRSDSRRTVRAAPSEQTAQFSKGWCRRWQTNLQQLPRPMLHCSNGR
jgi:hypothetical protein